MSSIKILSMDPGTTNYAWSVMRVGIIKGKFRIKLIASGILQNPIREPLKVMEQAEAYEEEILSIEDTYGPFDAIIMERFQTRGLKGKTIESIGFMIGRMTACFDLTLYTAATWKNAFNRVNDLKDLYEDLKDQEQPTKKSRRFTIHELDCTLMGIYHGCKHFDVVAFETLTKMKTMAKFLRVASSKTVNSSVREKGK